MDEECLDLSCGTSNMGTPRQPHQADTMTVRSVCLTTATNAAPSPADPDSFLLSQLVAWASSTFSSSSPIAFVCRSSAASIVELSHSVERAKDRRNNGVVNEGVFFVFLETTLHFSLYRDNRYDSSPPIKIQGKDTFAL